MRGIFFFCLFSIIYSQSGLEIAKLINERSMPISMSSKISMTLTNSKNKTRKSVMISKSTNRNKYQLIWVLEPKSDRGMSFLKKEHSDQNHEMRIWLPAFNKIRRINANRMSDSFMGSDLSYEDMTSRSLSENNYFRLEDEIIQGDSCYVLKVIPKAEFRNSYGMHKIWVSKDRLYIVKENSFDKKNRLKKIKTFFYTKIENYFVASKIFVNDIQKNHTTNLNIENIRVDSDIDSDLFQEKSLKRIPSY